MQFSTVLQLLLSLLLATFAAPSWIDVTSPSMGGLVETSDVTIHFSLRDGLRVPRDGVVRVVANDQEPFDLRDPMESITIGDVQPGTHFFRFTFIPSAAAETAGRRRAERFDDALLIVERVPRAIARFDAPASSLVYNGGGGGAPRPLRIAFCGTTKLDGQKSIWLQQIERVQRAADADEAAFVCLTCDGPLDAPLANQVRALGARFVASAKLSLPRAVATHPSFPANVVALLRGGVGSAACAANDDAAAACAALDASLVRPLRGFDVAVFANSQEPQDVLLAEGARAAGVRAVVMDLPNLRPHPTLAGLLDGVVAPSHFALLHDSVHAGRGWCRPAARGGGTTAGECGVVINPSVDAARFVPADPDADAGRRPLRVGFVGRVAPEKSPGLFLAAAQRVLAELGREPLRSGRAVRFVVIGDGFVRPLLEAYARSLGESVARAVEFTGWVEWQTLPALLSTLDVVVNPSLRDSETFCISNIEALASAVPLVTFGSGGIGEYMVNGTTGLVAVKPNAASLARQILALLRRPAERKRMGAEGRRAVRRRFGVDAMVERYLDFYRQRAGVGDGDIIGNRS